MKAKSIVEVCFTPEQYPNYKHNFDIVVVIDVLRASSVICTAFQFGVKRIIPVSSIEKASIYLKNGYHVAAERMGEIVDGFILGNSPLAYRNSNLKGKTLVITTTNGTKAIETAKDCDQLLIGSFLNLDVLSDYLTDLNKNVLLLASGWQGKFSLEDTLCAGAICDQLLRTNKFTTNYDSTVASKYLYHSARSNYFGFLKASSHRKRLKRLNLNNDIKYCLTPNQTNVIPYREKDYLKIF